jgi:cysteine desulfuration protein SufE
MQDSLTQAKIERCPPALQQIVEEFREATPRERMEYLLEYADSLPPLPAHLAARRDQMEQVHECQAPVFLFTELAGDTVHFFIDIPPESPTIRGYASILIEGLQGATPQQVLETPDDIYMLLGLAEVITPQRVRGLHALLGYMKKQLRNLLHG